MWETAEEPGAGWNEQAAQGSHPFDAAVFDADIFDADYDWIDGDASGDGWVVSSDGGTSWAVDPSSGDGWV
jgi:hypothetical protein